MFLKNGEGMDNFVRARVGGAKHSTMYLWIPAFAFPLQKSPLQKVFGFVFF